MCTEMETCSGYSRRKHKDKLLSPIFIYCVGGVEVWVGLFHSIQTEVREQSGGSQFSPTVSARTLGTKSRLWSLAASLLTPSAISLEERN